jgi:NADPH-dependent curcumin reductase CurA
MENFPEKTEFDGRLAYKKSPLKSKGVMGPISALLSTALAAYLSYQSTGKVGDAEAVALVSAAVGSLVGLIGRIQAKRGVQF